MTERKISANSLALGNALVCDIASLREAAVKYIKDAIEEAGGLHTTVPASLGVAPATYFRWLQAHPDLAKYHAEINAKTRTERKIRGPAPAAASKSKKKAKRR